MGQEPFIDNRFACHRQEGQGAGALPALPGSLVAAQDPAPPRCRAVLGSWTTPGVGHSLSNREAAACT